MSDFPDISEALLFQAGILVSYVLIWYFTGYKYLPISGGDLAEVIPEFNLETAAAVTYVSEEPLWPVVVVSLLSFQKWWTLYMFILVNGGAGVPGLGTFLTIAGVLLPFVNRGPFVPPPNLQLPNSVHVPVTDVAAAAQALFSTADLPLFEIYPLQWWLFHPSLVCTFYLLWKIGKTLFPDQ